MALQPVLIDGVWREADATGSFQADNPTTCEPLPDVYPISAWADCDAALSAAVQAYEGLRQTEPGRIANFLDAFAGRIESASEELVAMAHDETALPASPRLARVELPRTTNQLRLAARAARDGSWRLTTIDTAAGIRSCLAPIGPVWVFGPNNFPFAFGSASGGDFAAAIAAGNPVIAKANSSHPGTTRIFAEQAEAACREVGLPPATVQLLYRTSHADGERAVADPRTGATGYTGSRTAGLKLKAAADAAGKPIYLELSSVNPVVILPGAVRERGEQIAGEFVTSCLMGTGQFCTNPGLVLLIQDAATDSFVAALAEGFQQAAVGTLLSRSVGESLRSGMRTLQEAGAEVLVGGDDDSQGPPSGQGYRCANTLLRVSGERFLADAERLQTEVFGNASLLVIADDLQQASAIVERFEGNLTGCVYSDTTGSDDEAYDRLAPGLRQCVGRLLNDRMPTGVAVSPAMNHGGPYPSTGHPGFTAVGIPAALRRFAMLQCYDNVRAHRLPLWLQDANPGEHWRCIDGRWTQDDVPVARQA
jgi:alpha-ketoglutaric semialdehyde dehydrogenase